MDKERYEKLKKLMEAIKDIPYFDISISDYKYFNATITLEKEK